MSNAQIKSGEKSSSRILKSTAIIGGSNAVGTLFRIARTKAFAILLGPAGMGLVGIYSSIMSTTTAISGLGVGSSGVRQVAEASGDENKMANTLFCLRFVTPILGTLGAFALIALSRTLSNQIFNNYDYALPLAVLSLGVLFQIISDSQMALLNGLRRVGDMARINVISSAVATILAIAVVWRLGERAIAWATVIPVVATLGCSWWFVRSIHLPSRRLSWRELKTGVFSLFRIGLAFMVGGLLMTGALLFTRLVFVERLGLAATGLFQAAWGIAVTNIDFILSAMGIDFYPHLTACVTRDPRDGTRLVNEQTEVALFLGGPVILGMISFAGPLIHFFFSGRFALATDLLRWLVLGSVLKLVSWPVSFLIIARGWASAYFLAEFVWCASYVGFLYFWTAHFGLNSAGYAFVAAYLVYTLVVYSITHSMSGFRWTLMSGGLACALLIAGAAILYLTSHTGAVGYWSGGLITLGFSIFSIRKLYDAADNPTAKHIVSLLRRKANFLNATAITR